ncbi:MAG: DUF924 family protein [Gammaproteobacteria bacterium]
MSTKADYSDVLRFWFEELEPEQHFRKSARVDDLIHERFAAVHAAASHGELVAWRDSAAGRLAEIIVLDQFSRNLYREDARAYACDGMALVLAQEAVRAGVDRELPLVRRAFFYLPYEHSESLLVHQTALKLFSQPGLEDNLKFERKHRAVIERFGRYPARNAARGLTSTMEEAAFLASNPSGF